MNETEKQINNFLNQLDYRRKKRAKIYIEDPNRLPTIYFLEYGKGAFIVGKIKRDLYFFNFVLYWTGFTLFEADEFYLREIEEDSKFELMFDYLVDVYMWGGDKVVYDFLNLIYEKTPYTINTKNTDLNKNFKLATYVINKQEKKKAEIRIKGI